MPLKTKLTEMLGIEHPIICGGMQYVGCESCTSTAALTGLIAAWFSPLTDLTSVID